MQMRKTSKLFKNIIPRSFCTEFIHLEMEGRKILQMKD